MKFSQLIKESSLKFDSIKPDFEVKGLAYDSRKVKKGYVFFAVKGYKDDGNKYIKNALASGALAVISDESPENLPFEVSAKEAARIYKVNSARKAMAELSSAFYGKPGEKIKVIGVTGTNGKTTIIHLIKAGLEEAGHKAGLIGTIVYQTGKKKITSSLTTPDSIEFNAMLAEMVNAGLEYCVMEVSSIALLLDRVYGIRFDIAVFTNLSSEHLDLHENMENYFEAKKILFDSLTGQSCAVSNKDDDYGENILKDTKAKKVFYSLNNESDLKAENYKLGIRGSEFDITDGGRAYHVKSALTGKFNIYNILAAISALKCSGAAMDVIIKAMSNMEPVNGRFNSIKLPNGAFAVVDYSHTSDSLKNAIEAAIEIVNEQEVKGRIITVFGCGGDKDRTKRPVMGRTATDLSDFTIITSDNPRTEEPMGIINEILSGVENKGSFEVEPDREKAIKRAIEVSKNGDIVLICGKGHETYQEINGIRIHFDDKEMVEKYSELAA